MDDLAAELGQLKESLPPTDGLKWFVLLYADITAALARMLDASGFEAPDFISALAVDFGRRFLATLADPGSATPAWQPIFERRHDDRIAPLQFAIAGLGAHLGYDAPMGLELEWRAAGVDPVPTSAEHRDWDRVNQTIATVEPVDKRYLLTGAVKEVDRVFDGADDVVAGWTVEAAREAAWAHAIAIYKLADDPALLEIYLAGLGRSVGLVTSLLLVPTAV